MKLINVNRSLTAPLHFFNNQFLFILLCTLCGLFLNSCASNNKVSQDFKPDTDFTRYKTFAWRNFSSEIVESNRRATQMEIEQLLIQQGFSPATENADMLVDVNIISQRSEGSKSGVSMSIGLPIGNHGGVGLGTNKLFSRDDDKEGLIIMDITDQKTNQALWRGTSSSIPISYFYTKNEAQLNATLKNLVTQFPPKK